jgi:hypothetical protein
LSSKIRDLLMTCKNMNENCQFSTSS